MEIHLDHQTINRLMNESFTLWGEMSPRQKKIAAINKIKSQPYMHEINPLMKFMLTQWIKLSEARIKQIAIDKIKMQPFFGLLSRHKGKTIKFRRPLPYEAGY